MSNTQNDARLAVDSQNAYNQNWTIWDQLDFNKILIDEKEVVCQWIDYQTPCGEVVKGRDLKAHLHGSHRVTNDLQLYTCLWRKCSARPMKKSSLERHVIEQHNPVKWACPLCPDTFTRDTTLSRHMSQNHAHA